MLAKLHNHLFPYAGTEGNFDAVTIKSDAPTVLLVTRDDYGIPTLLHIGCRTNLTEANKMPQVVRVRSKILRIRLVLQTNQSSVLGYRRHMTLYALLRGVYFRFYPLNFNVKFRLMVQVLCSAEEIRCFLQVSSFKFQGGQVQCDN